MGFKFLKLLEAAVLFQPLLSFLMILIYQLLVYMCMLLFVGVGVARVVYVKTVKFFQVKCHLCVILKTFPPGEQLVVGLCKPNNLSYKMLFILIALCIQCTKQKACVSQTTCVIKCFYSVMHYIVIVYQPELAEGLCKPTNLSYKMLFQHIIISCINQKKKNHV